MSAVQWFNSVKAKLLGTKTATGTATLTAFYDGAAGTLTRLAVSAATQNTPSWRRATPPEFTLTSNGGEIYGALIHLVNHTPTSFVVKVERITGDPSSPGSGDLALTWTRRGTVL